MAYLKPDRYFSRLSQISIEKDILACGFENVLLDIDNTFVPRDTQVIPRDARVWLGCAREAGVTICLLSNNWHKVVYDFADEVGLPIVAKAMKPCPPAYFTAMRKIGAKRKNTVAIGDQLMTDVLGAHTVGIKAYLIQPLVEQDLPHTLFLRHFERVLMGDAKPEAPVACEQGEEVRI